MALIVCTLWPPYVTFPLLVNRLLTINRVYSRIYLFILIQYYSLSTNLNCVSYKRLYGYVCLSKFNFSLFTSACCVFLMFFFFSLIRNYISYLFIFFSLYLTCVRVTFSFFIYRSHYSECMWCFCDFGFVLFCFLFFFVFCFFFLFFFCSFIRNYFFFLIFFNLSFIRNYIFLIFFSFSLYSALFHLPMTLACRDPSPITCLCLLLHGKKLRLFSIFLYIFFISSSYFIVYLFILFYFIFSCLWEHACRCDHI